MDPCLNLGRVELGGGGAAGETLAARVDGLAGELLPKNVSKDVGIEEEKGSGRVSTRNVAYSMRRSWLYSIKISCGSQMGSGVTHLQRAQSGREHRS
jgi:hypothetical protein